jgi:hypothetical protein
MGADPPIEHIKQGLQQSFIKSLERSSASPGTS